jgi:threonine/homoserine/homoserine lactone efflux protein
VSGLDHVAPAFGLGFALGAAPGPVQLLILTETSRRGLSGGLRVMLGANGALVVVMVALALGFSSFQPGPVAVRVLRVAGGLFLGYLGAAELRTLRRERAGEERVARGRSFGPTAKGILSVILSPGAWVFFATTASAVVVDARTHGGRAAAFAAAIAMAAGVSTSDVSFTLLGSGGSQVLRERGLTILRGVLAAGLIGIGVGFVWLGLTAA